MCGLETAEDLFWLFAEMLRVGHLHIALEVRVLHDLPRTRWVDADDATAAQVEHIAAVHLQQHSRGRPYMVFDSAAVGCLQATMMQSTQNLAAMLQPNQKLKSR